MTIAQAVPDPQQLTRLIDQFSTRHPGIWQELHRDKDRLRWLITIFNFSHFLADELIRHPKWIWSIGEIHRARAFSDYKEHLAFFLRQRAVTNPTAFELALFRRKELLRLVVRDALSLAPLAEITQELSESADAILECALTTVSQEVESYGRPLKHTGSHAANDQATFTVLALGKLGGRELNYSSDIDLMFLYSDNGETSGAHTLTNKEFFKKVANQLTNLLSTYTAAGMCYRSTSVFAPKELSAMSASRSPPPKNTTPGERVIGSCRCSSKRVWRLATRPSERRCSIQSRA